MEAGREPLDAVIEHLETELAKGGSAALFAPLAEAYLRRGDHPEAIRVARTGLDKHPGHVSILVVLARAIAATGGHDEAAEAYRNVIRADPQNEEALGFLRMRHDPVTRESYRDQPQGPFDASSLSRELESLEDLFSLPEGDRPLLGQPEELEGIATLTLAEVYARQGLTERALRVCERILHERPEDEMARAKLTELKNRLASEQSSSSVAYDRREIDVS
jgi:tetratricopeptide (TPR) repeat protein